MPSPSGNIEGDLFGPLYTYQELLEVDRPKTIRAKAACDRDLTRPDHWPADTAVDPGVWVAWLPLGWGQGIKDTFGKDGQPTGKTLRCFISPADHTPVKRFFHKPVVEEYCQKAGLPGLNTGEGAELVKPEKAEKKVKTVHDGPPTWPEDWETPLPKDWRVAWKQLPAGLHRIYIPPGQDAGFLYHRTCVDQYLYGGGKSLVPFASSRPMYEKMADAAANKADSAKTTDKRRRVKPSDFVKSENLVVLGIQAVDGTLAARLEALGATSDQAAALASLAAEVREFLSLRAFDSVDDGDLLILFCRPSGGIIEQLISGVFYRRPDDFGTRPYYQKIAKDDDRLACASLFMFWSNSMRCWQVATAFNDKLAIARCSCDQPSPLMCGSADTDGAPWTVIEDEWLSDRWTSDGGEEQRKNDKDHAVLKSPSDFKEADTVEKQPQETEVAKSGESGETKKLGGSEERQAQGDREAPEGPPKKVARTSQVGTGGTSATSAADPEADLATQSNTLASVFADGELELHTQKIITVIEANNWPPWLPNDWGITEVKGKKKVYVVPGWKSLGRMRFFNSKTDVEKVYMTGLPQVKRMSGKVCGVMRLPPEP